MAFSLIARARVCVCVCVYVYVCVCVNICEGACELVCLWRGSSGTVVAQLGPQREGPLIDISPEIRIYALGLWVISCLTKRDCSVLIFHRSAGRDALPIPPQERVDAHAWRARELVEAGIHFLVLGVSDRLLLDHDILLQIVV